jgi:hypothetical protein
MDFANSWLRMRLHVEAFSFWKDGAMGRPVNFSPDDFPAKKANSIIQRRPEARKIRLSTARQ